MRSPFGPPEGDGSVFHTLRELEESLYRPLTRFNTAHMESLLAPEFIEFGTSGRVWTRGQIIRTGRVRIAARLPLPDFAVVSLSEEVALVTYRSEMGVNFVDVANRSSLWRRGPNGWQLVFHQGTSTNRRQGTVPPELSGD
jgi:hypothetical protein